MPAHGAEPFVVQKENAEVTVGCDRFGRNAAVHIGMTARFPHDGRAQPVVVGLGVAAFWPGCCCRVNRASRW